MEMTEEEKKKRKKIESLTLKKNAPFANTEISAPQSTGSQLAAGAEAGASSSGGGVMSGAAQGAAMGSAAGPYGALAGAALGAAKGLMGKKQAKAERKRQAKLKQAEIFQKQGQDEANILQNLMNSLRQTILF